MATRLIISGRVQGVFYRAWSTGEAKALHLSGWVRNRRNGDVEMLLDGPEEKIAEMIRRCQRGPPSAKVDQVRTEEADEEVPEGFEKRPTV